MKKREAISKSTRFEVFKRDSFTCQYCGASAPAVILNLDHIMAVSKGGTSDVTNLITACFGCNSGKSDRKLSDDTALAKKKRQLDQLQARREQLEMIAEWQIGLVDLDAQALELVCDAWRNIAPGYFLNDIGRHGLKKTLARYGLAEVIESMRRSASYFVLGQNGEYTSESVNLATSKIPAICSIRKREREDPVLAEIHHIVSSSEKRLNGYHTRWKVVADMKAAIERGATTSQLWDMSRSSGAWISFIDKIQDFASEQY